MAPELPDRVPGVRPAGSSGNLDVLTSEFERIRPQLKAVAYRVLGTVAEADDALQDAWVNATKTPHDDIENPAAWLTTVVARTALTMARSRRRRGEQPLDTWVPDPLISPEDAFDPEQQAMLADGVGMALQVVLQTMTPNERVAFVLHDLFAVPYEEIAQVIGCSPESARQHASRARRRVRSEVPLPEADRQVQRRLVSAFFDAAHRGDIAALLEILHPDAVLRSDAGGAGLTLVIRGAQDIARSAVGFGRLSPFVQPVLVNGAAGAIAVREGNLLSVMAFTVHAGTVTAIDVIAEPERLQAIARSGLL